MNVDDAAHAVVHDYPGGSESLAPRMAMSPAVLNSKVNPNTRTHHLTLREAIRITQLTGDARILQAAACECDKIILDMPCDDDTAASDMAILELIAAVWAKQGELGTAVHGGFADGKLTPAEFYRIKSAISRAQAQMAALGRRIESMVEQGS